MCIRDRAETQSEIQQMRDQTATKKERQSSINLLLSELGKQLSASNSQVKLMSGNNEKLQKRLQSLDQDITAKSQKLQSHHDTVQRLENEATDKNSALKEARNTVQQVNADLAETQKGLAEKRRAQTGATQRAEVIQELENRLEGVDSGVKELLERSKNNDEPWLQDVMGLVADVIKVNVQHAELVDLALGDYARCLTVDGNQLVQRLVNGDLKPAGRVRLIQLQDPPTLGTQPGVDLSNHDGVVGRLDQLVQVDSEYTKLVSRLLGGTFLVKTLADAIHLRERKPGLARFITLSGDVLEADGTLIAGPRNSAIGLVSRRSELRALHREIHRLTGEIREESETLKSLQTKSKECESVVEELMNENTELATRLNEQKSAASSLQQQIEVLNADRQQTDSDSAELTEQIQSLHGSITRDQATLQENESHLTQLVKFLHDGDDRLRDLELKQEQFQQQQTSLKVALAKSQQQHDAAENNLTQLISEQQENKQAIANTRSTIADMLWQRRGSLREVGQSTGLLQSLETQRGGLDQQLKSLTEKRQTTDNKRREISKALSETRDALRTSKDKLHQMELRENQLTLERNQLAQRLQDDYGIEVATLEAEEQEIDEDREAIDQEISDLRRKIGNIGSVNMDALVELEEMQIRFESLDAQYQDLVKSREALEKIIQKINNDSRRLFEETVMAIRSNFQRLFRQTFGGGRADLVFDEDVDILEAGIDIVATPPGKPEFNNSLLSGGERALTAVSLLMAIFQFRPSPFCVLDEVDAPFDEANVGRFIDVLRSFLEGTKFVIVTHSKVTMTAATTLYGVTMQESGVSKRVSVRFEDVSEDGQISDEAIQRDAGDEKVA